MSENSQLSTMEVKLTQPNLFVIGAMKAGSTSLHDILNSHPSINMSKVKEINYYSKNLAKGEEWYLSHFDFNARYAGESSVSYSRESLFPGSAKRLLSSIANPKIIYIIRNPVDRIESDYREHRFHNLITDRGINSFFSKGEISNTKSPAYHMFNASCYAEQLKVYKETLDRNNILILKLEDLKKDRAAVLQQVANFLDIAPFQAVPEVKSNSSTDKRQLNNRGVFMSRVFVKLNKIPFVNLTNRMLYVNFFSKEIPFEILSKESLSLIDHQLISDLEHLNKEFDVSTEDWIEDIKKRRNSVD